MMEKNSSMLMKYRYQTRNHQIEANFCEFNGNLHQNNVEVWMKVLHYSDDQFFFSVVYIRIPNYCVWIVALLVYNLWYIYNLLVEKMRIVSCEETNTLNKHTQNPNATLFAPLTFPPPQYRMFEYDCEINGTFRIWNCWQNHSTKKWYIFDKFCCWMNSFIDQNCKNFRIR